MQHSPAPWSVVRQGRGRILVKPAGSETQIAQLFSYMASHEENIANWRTITFAPDLLAACEAIRDYEPAPCETDDGCAFCMVRAAVAKVKGNAK